MPYSHKKSILTLCLVIAILLALFILVARLGYNIGLNAAEGLAVAQIKNRNTSSSHDVYLTSISLAENAKLTKASGVATIEKTAGKMAVDVVLPAGASIPAGSVLEAWLVDAGKNGGLGATSVSDNDQKFGTPFANADFSASVDGAPFAAALGALNWDEARGSYYLNYNSAQDLTPYDAVMITLESDGNSKNYDPRPGTPILIGKIE